MDGSSVLSDVAAFWTKDDAGPSDACVGDGDKVESAHDESSRGQVHGLSGWDCKINTLCDLGVRSGMKIKGFASDVCGS